jgi:hypothetical protein
MSAQLDREALKSMTHAQIVQAKAEGRLDDLLGIETVRVPDRATREDIRWLAAQGHHEAIAEAKREGRLDHLLSPGANQ